MRHSRESGNPDRFSDDESLRRVQRVLDSRFRGNDENFRFRVNDGVPASRERRVGFVNGALGILGQVSSEDGLLQPSFAA